LTSLPRYAFLPGSFRSFCCIFIVSPEIVISYFRFSFYSPFYYFLFFFCRRVNFLLLLPRPASPLPGVVLVPLPLPQPRTPFTPRFFRPTSLLFCFSPRMWSNTISPEFMISLFRPYFPRFLIFRDRSYVSRPSFHCFINSFENFGTLWFFFFCPPPLPVWYSMFFSAKSVGAFFNPLFFLLLFFFFYAFRFIFAYFVVPPTFSFFFFWPLFYLFTPDTLPSFTVFAVGTFPRFYVPLFFLFFSFGPHLYLAFPRTP